MSSDPSNDAYRDPLGSITTFTYDAEGGMTCVGRETSTFYYDATGASVEAPRPVHAEPPPARTPGQPRLTRTFEFRLTGAETQEQCVPHASGLAPAGLLLATQAVRAYLTRTAAPAALRMWGTFLTCQGQTGT